MPIRPAGTLVVAALLAAGAAPAARAQCWNCELPPGIQLVGTTNGVADAHGEAVVIVRDAGNQPVANSVVDLDFTLCYDDPAQDVWFATTQPFPGVTVSCPPAGVPAVRAVTDANGRAVFRVVGAAHALSGSPGITAACLRIRADGVILGFAYVGAYDLNGVDGVNVADLSLFLPSLFGGPSAYRARADYNNSGTVSAADLSKILGVVFGGGSAASAAADCLD